MSGGKQSGGTSPGRKDQDGPGMLSKGFQTQDGHGVVNIFCLLSVRVRTHVVSTTVCAKGSVHTLTCCTHIVVHIARAHFVCAHPHMFMRVRSNASKFNMFRNSSSRSVPIPSSGNFPLSAVRSRLRSAGGVSHKSLLTAAIHPASELSFPGLDPCSDSLPLGVPAVKLDATPGLISDSPIFFFFKPTSGSGTVCS